jgi:RHS repeat-associated protein
MRNGGVPTTYSYNAANELTRSQGQSGTTTYTYDGSGNLVTARPSAGARTTYSWDTECRLTGVVLPAGTTDAFTYNGDGQRVQKVDSGGTTNFVWDGQNVLLEASAGNVIQAVYTLEPQAYGNLVSQRRGGATSFYHFDGLGSTAQLTGATGSVTDSYLYDSWGNILITTGSTGNPFKFVGRLGYYFTPDLVDYFVRARFYAAGSGRFLSRDPLGEAISINGQTCSFYQYTYYNPVNHVDPSGQQPITPPSAIKVVVTEVKECNQEFSCNHKISCYKFTLVGPGSEKANGFIVQNLNRTTVTKNCQNNPFAPDSQGYYEAWEVVDGKIYEGYKEYGLTDLKFHDCFLYCAVSNPKTKGQSTTTGYVRFIPGLKSTSSWKPPRPTKQTPMGPPPACPLPNDPCTPGQKTTSGVLPTLPKPPGWDSAPVTNRPKDIYNWDCCNIC